MLTKPSTIPFNKRTKRKLLFSSGIFCIFSEFAPQEEPLVDYDHENLLQKDHEPQDTEKRANYIRLL